MSSQNGFSAFSIFKELKLDDYINNQTHYFQKMFDFADTFETKDVRNQIIKTVIANLYNSNQLSQLMENQFKMSDETILQLCQAYFNENSTLGFNPNSPSLAAFIDSFSDQRILKFLNEDRSFTMTKAAFMIEIYSTCERHSGLKRNFNGSLYYISQKYIEQFKQDKVELCSYELTEKLIYGISNGSNTKRYKHLNCDLFFSYVADEHFKQLIEHHPNLIFDTNRNFLIERLLNHGYDEVLINNPEKTKEKINSYLKGLMFTQANYYLPFVQFNAEDLNHIDEYMKEKFKAKKYGYEFQEKSYQQFKIYMEQQYLNLATQERDSQKDNQPKKVKAKI
jgi:hypothetical protein